MDVNTYDVQILLGLKQTNMSYKNLSFDFLLSLNQLTHISFSEQKNVIKLHRIFKAMINGFDIHFCLLQKKHVWILHLPDCDVDFIKADLTYIFKKEKRNLKKTLEPKTFRLRSTLRALADDTLKTHRIGFISARHNYIVFFDYNHYNEFKWFIRSFKTDYTPESGHEETFYKYSYNELEKKLNEDLEKMKL